MEIGCKGPTSSLDFADLDEVAEMRNPQSPRQKKQGCFARKGSCILAAYFSNWK
jgi:hypothetical protein